MYNENLFNEERVANLVKTLERLSQMKDATLEEKLEDKNVKCFNNIIYVPFDEVLLECGYFICCVAGDVILTDSNFENLSDNAKYFILLHETGHKYYKHTEMLAGLDQSEILETRIKYIEEGKVMPIELEADSYALNFISKQQAYEALDELQTLMDENFVDDEGEVALRKEFILK